MARKKTHEEFVKEVYNLEEDNYTVLGTYINSRTPIKIRHNCEKCNNYEWNIVPNQFTSRGDRCPKCAGCQKGDTESFKKEVENITNNEYTVIGNYIDNTTKIKFLHNTCTKEFEISPTNFRRGQRCPYCTGNMKITHEEFVQKVYDLEGDNYTVLGKYTKKRNTVKMRHNCETCNNYEWDALPFRFLNNGDRCPKCSGCMKKNKEILQEELNEIYGYEEYTVIDEYINDNTEIRFRHNCDDCGDHIFKRRPRNMTNGHKPICKCDICRKGSSGPAKTLMNILDKQEIEYDTEFRFKDCKDINTLPFDFKYNDILIEYDGDQHWKPRGNDTKESFNNRKKHDNLKNKYAFDNDITLIRIPYTVEPKDFSKIIDMIMNKQYIELLEYNILVINGKNIMYNGELYNESIALLNNNDEESDDNE